MDRHSVQAAGIAGLLCWATTAGATMFDFDGMGLTPGMTLTPSYGFDWGGLVAGEESGNIIAVGNSSPVTIKRIDPREIWTFEGALFKSAVLPSWITLKGFMGGQEQWAITDKPLTGTFALLDPGTAIAQQWIDSLEISVSTGPGWMMDNFVDAIRTTTPIPETSSVVLGGLLCLPILVAIVRRYHTRRMF
jgi:hypothetical protein